MDRVVRLARELGRRLSSTPGHRENRPLTSLRGLAALWVVAHHVWPAWGLDPSTIAASVAEDGFVSVDIFFILSGFILATVYAGLRADGVPRYALRRLCRVLPLHWAVLGALALNAALGPYLSAHPHPLAPRTWEELPAVALLLQSYVLDHTPWNPPTWSIGIELLAYALLPVALVAVRRARHSTALVAALIVALAAVEYWVQRDYAGALVGRGAILRGMAGFFLGMAIAAARSPSRAWPDRIASAAQVAAIALFGFGVWRTDPAIMTLASALLIAALADERGLLTRAMSNGVLVWLGAISYSIYLLHTPLLVLVGRLPLPAPVKGALLVGILLPLATLTWWLIEQPGRRIPSLWNRRGQPTPNPSRDGGGK